MPAMASPAAGGGAMSPGGAMTMRPVAAIAIAADASTVLKPGGYHIMLIDLKAPLKAGESIPLILTFEKAGTIRTTAVVRPM